MIKITKSIIIFSLIVFALTTGANILAEENTSSDATAAAINEQITSQNLDVSDPKLLPGNPFYFLKEWSRGIQSFFAFGNLKKAELYQKFASERLVELKKFVEEGEISSDILEKATDKYEKTMDKIKEKADKIEETASDSEEVNKFLEKFTNQQVLHEKILQKLEEKAPEQVLEKIKEAREWHLEKFKEVMTKLENNKDRIAEKVKNALQNGDTANPEILDRIKDKMPDDVKEKIDAVRTKVIDKVVEKIKQKNPVGAGCPVLSVSANFCKGGKITAERNSEGCIIKLKCTPILPSGGDAFCTQEYNPVCGADGKTYSNGCVAQNVGTTIAYKGECSKNNTGFIKGEVSIGPLCPVEPCPLTTPNPYIGKKITLNQPGSAAIYINLNSDGTFSGSAPAEKFSLNITDCQYLGCKNSLPKIVEIKAGETTEININIDTGIR